MFLPKFSVTLVILILYTPLATPSYADKLYLGFAKGPLQELLAIRDIQSQVLLDRTDTNFIDITDDFDDGTKEFSVEKQFASENWDISIRSEKKSNGAFQRVLYLSPLDAVDSGMAGVLQTFCQEVNSLLVSELGEPNLQLDTSTPLPNETRVMSTSELRSTWHHQGFGVYSDCLAVHFYQDWAESGPIITSPAFVTIALTDFEEMQTIHPLTHVTCSYNGTFRNEDFPEGFENGIVFDWYLNETDGELLGLDKRVVARDVIFTGGEIIGGWQDAKFARKFRINRYSAASIFSGKSVSDESDLSFESHSGECLAHTDRKF